jgi:hypothetical protein
MEKRCARCGLRWSPDIEWHSLCGEGENGCAQAVDLYGSGKLWVAVGTLINGEWTVEEMKDLSDSPAFFDFVDELLREKDMDTRRNWILKHAKRIAKESEK